MGIHYNRNSKLLLCVNTVGLWVMINTWKYSNFLNLQQSKIINSKFMRKINNQSRQLAESTNVKCRARPGTKIVANCRKKFTVSFPRLPVFFLNFFYLSLTVKTTTIQSRLPICPHKGVPAAKNFQGLRPAPTRGSDPEQRRIQRTEGAMPPQTHDHLKKTVKSCGRLVVTQVFRR